jgi:hypothetical protein
MVWFGFGYCFTSTDTNHIWGGWSHYIDTREPIDGHGTQNMVTV